MKPIITFIIICISAVHNFELDKISGVLGRVQIIEFDSESNIYIGSNLPSDAAIYKLNPAKEIIVKHEGWLVYVKNILISSSNNAYVFDDANGGDMPGGQAGILFIGHNQTSMDRLYEFPMNDEQLHVYVKDRKGNIYLNTANGVAVIKPQEIEARGISVPKCVDNLENFSITNEFTYAIDSYGNVYLGGTFNGDSVPQIAVIRSQEQDKLIPSAEIYDAPKLNLRKISSMGFDANAENLLIAFSGNQGRIYNFIPSYSQLIFGEYLYEFSSLYSTKDKFYFFGKNTYIGSCYLHVGYYDYRQYSYNITALPNPLDLCGGVNFTSDSDGNIYFASEKEVYSLRNNVGMDLVKIIFPTELQHKITALLVDDNDDLWILAGNLYVARKDLLEAMQYTYTPFALEEGVMKLHPYTKEIFIGSENGLYVFSNKSK